MAKVIKLKDRQGSLVLPLTRSQLVQVSEITGLNLTGSATWTKASVQDALEALYSYASTNNAQYDADILQIKNALQGLLDATGAVANAVADAQTNSYAYAETKASEAQTNSYAWAEAKADEAEQAAKDYGDDTFLNNVKLNGSYITVQTDDSHGRYVDLGSIATSEGLDNLVTKVNAIEAAYITTEDSEAADAAIVTAYEAADAAIITGYQAADTAIINAYTAADTAIINAYTAADTALSNRIDALESSYEVTMTATDGAGAGSYLKRYTITQGSETIGTIDIPRDLLATSGELVYGSLSGDTFTPAEGGDAHIKMTVGNGVDTQAFYIPVQSLIEYNSVSSTDEITLTDTNHTISATVGDIDSSKITYTAADGGNPRVSVQSAIADLYSQVGEGGSVTQQINTALDALDASYTASGTAAHSGTYVMNAVTQDNGKITSIGSVEVEAAGAAAAVKDELTGTATTYTNLGAVETEIGAIRTAIDNLDGDAVKSVNGQNPDASGAVTVNASQIDTSYTYKIGNDASATTHTVDEVLAAGVYFEELSGISGDATADTTLFT